VAPPSGNIKSNRWAIVGFLLVFRTLYSSNCSRLRVIIDFQPRKVKPEVEISLNNATHENKLIGTMGRYRIPISTQRSCNSSGARLIIDYQRSKVRPEAEMALCGAT
jgi:hypothetical protein